jgi:3D (Asp-Asp-Asp) domain-containing protein
MKNIARGSMFFGVIALIMTTFIFQTTAEAALVIASDSRNKQLNIQEILEETSPFIQDIYTPGIEAMTLDASLNLDDNNSSGSEAAVGGGKAYKATAYCLKGRTASGSSVRRGIVAADPRVLPLGTTIEIDAGSYSGTYTVADTGGAIRGRILDVWVPSCAEAQRFGRKKVSVRVVKRKKRK